MFKLSFAFMALSFIGCSTAGKNPMAIRYTSINDVYANYVFNFNDNTNGIKQLYDYAINDLQTAKRYRDSMRSIHLQPNPAENIPIKAEPVTFYRPPGELKGQPDSIDQLICFKTDENTFVLNNIEIPACEQVKRNQDCSEISTDSDNCTLQLKSAGLDLCALKVVFDKIKSLKYHLAKRLYSYQIIAANRKELLKVNYTDNGKSLKLLFPTW